jgi:hypothetical protein
MRFVASLIRHKRSSLISDIFPYTMALMWPTVWIVVDQGLIISEAKSADLHVQSLHQEVDIYVHGNLVL